MLSKEDASDISADFITASGVVYGLIPQLVGVSHTWDWRNSFQANGSKGLVLQSGFLAGFSLVFPCMAVAALVHGGWYACAIDHNNSR